MSDRFPSIDTTTRDRRRLAALDAYDILDTPAEAGFDDIVQLASHICDTSVSLISFIASDRQWFKARVGFAHRETPLDQSVCSNVVRERDIVVIPDLSLDPRTRGNPLVVGEPHIRFYAGAPVETDSGDILGALCVIDVRPRPEGLTPAQGSMLRKLAAQVMTQLELRRLARSQRETAVTLERRVEERTVELRASEEKLRQSQKMEAVGQLTGGIAHDFNNLLTGITGALDLMSRRVSEGRMADVERYIKTAMVSANRAAALTHRLLAFSRRQPLDPRPTDCDQLVASMAELLRRTIGETIVLDIVSSGRHGLTLCDRHQLENALLNLVINARDAMPDGGRLTISTSDDVLDQTYCASRDLTPGPYVRVSVADTGIGMTPDVLARAFDPFFTTKPIGQGTGLGLSMTYGFVRQSEGHVRIDSEPGKGTVVSLYLPRFDGGLAEEGAGAAPSASQLAVAGESVLVVEDERSVREFVVEVLGDLGYRVVEASDGPAALRVLQSSERVDLMVTDVGLPGMNGRQVADLGRRLRPDLMVLFITGYAENATFGDGAPDGATQMLTKPFSIDAFADRVRAMLGDSSTAVPPARLAAPRDAPPFCYPDPVPE